MKLHNGIELDDNFPPKYTIDELKEGMPVPYLKKAPNPIPLSRYHECFIDNFIVEETDATQQVFSPTPCENNPVLFANQEHEFTANGYPYAAPFSDAVIYDEDEKLFKMWYLAGGLAKFEDGKTINNRSTCYAFSKDGKNWIKPSLDVVPGTNIVDTEDRDSVSIFLDKNEVDENKKYKMFATVITNDDIVCQMIYKTSKDGIHWSDVIAQSGSLSDRSTVFYNHQRDKWVLSGRHQTEVSNRSRLYLEADTPEDLVSYAHRLNNKYDDQHVRLWFVPDIYEKKNTKYPDVQAGIYNFDVTPYEDFFIGFYSVWLGPENNICKENLMPKHNEIQIGFSRDGYHFYRPNHESFVPLGSDNDWNAGNMQSVGLTPIKIKNDLYFYFSGREKNGLWWDSGLAVGLYTMKIDRFAGYIANGKKFLKTKKLLFQNDHLHLNIDLSSKSSHCSITFNDLENNCLYNGTLKFIDECDYIVHFDNLPSLKDKIGHLTFHLEDCNIYSIFMS